MAEPTEGHNLLAIAITAIATLIVNHGSILIARIVRSKRSVAVEDESAAADAEAKRIANSTTLVGVMQQVMDIARRTAEEQSAYLLAQIKALREELDEVRAKCDRQEVEIQSLQLQLAERDVKIASLQQRCTDLESENADLKRRIAA